MTPYELNELSKKIHPQNKAMGWWDEPRSTELLVELVHSEISEAMEGHRKNLMDDKLPHRKMYEVEYADAVIRLLDMGAAYGWEFSSGAPQGLYPGGYPDVGVAHKRIREQLQCLTIPGDWGWRERAYQLTVYAILHVANFYKCDIFGAIEEKLAFNLTRPDHSREARAGEHGKKF